MSSSCSTDQSTKMPSEDIATLVEMGFSMTRAEKALEVTGNKGVKPATEWLLANPEDTAEPASAEPAAEGSETGESSSTRKSLVPTRWKPKSGEIPRTDGILYKCNDCNMYYSSLLGVESHVRHTGHENFCETSECPKPPDATDKKEAVKQVEELLRKKRKEREEKEKQEAYEREKNRIRSGKEIAEARRKLEEIEMKKLIEQRARDKEEDRIARQRVREQIEADKAARKAKMAAENGQLAATPAANSPVAPAAPKRDYNETKIQIRLTNGETLVQTFGCKEQLSAVRLYVEMHRTDPAGPFDLMTTFPRKVFSADDYDTPLDVLGLVPSAVVIVQKKADL